MAIYKRKDTSLWWYDFLHAGKRYRGSTGASDKRKAKAFETAYVDKLRHQTSAKGVVENFRFTLSGGERIPLAKVFERFVAKPRRKQLANADGSLTKNAEAKQAVWLDFLAFITETYPSARNLQDISASMAEAYIHAFRSSGRHVVEEDEDEHRDIGEATEKGPASDEPAETPDETAGKKAVKPSNRTGNFYLQTLKEIFEKLKKDAGTDVNPFEEIEAQALNTEARDAFSPTELALIEKRADPFIYGVFMVGLNTGLREGDICTLRWSEVDVEGGWITKKMLKTNKVVRIPILKALSAWLRQQKHTDEFVLPEHAAMYSKNRTGISWRVKSFLDDIGITTSRKAGDRTRMVSVKDVHSLRHTFCYLAAAAGVPFPVVKSIVGHIDSKVTEHYMNHTTDELKREKLDALPLLFGKPPVEDAQDQGANKTAENLRIAIDDLVKGATVDQRRAILDAAKAVISGATGDAKKDGSTSAASP